MVSSIRSLIRLIICRALWGKESEISAEIEKLKSEVIKAEKSLDHATPGVSARSVNVNWI